MGKKKAAAPSVVVHEDSKKVDSDEIKPITHALFSLNISELVHSMRVQNGLRHNDAVHYKRYCSNRLSHLRKTLKHRNGRHRYNQKLFPSDFQDPRFLHLTMVQAERCWATHLLMKNALTAPNASGGFQTGAGTATAKQLNHWAERRLAKAVVFASRLVDICERHCDKQANMEARAYRDLFVGFHACERQEWQRCVEALTESRLLYVQLASLTSSNAVRSAAINEQLNKLDLTMRTANYYLARRGVEPPTPERVNNVHTEETIYWRGTQVALPKELLDSAQLDLVFEGIFTAEKLSEMRDAHVEEMLKNFMSAGKSQSILELYKATQHKSTEAIARVHATLLDSDTTTEAQAGYFFVLESIARDNQQLGLLEMNLMLLSCGIAEYLSGSILTGTKSCKSCPPSFGVFLSDLVIQLFDQMASDWSSARCPSSLQSQLTASMDLLTQRVKIWKQTARDCRAFFVCLSMCAAQKGQEAYVVMTSIQQGRKKAEELDLTIPDSDRWNCSPFFRLGASVALLDQLMSHATPSLEVDAAASLLSHATGTTQVKDSDVVKILSDQYLGEIKLTPIPCKPILFDLAESNIHPPKSTESNPGTPSAAGLVGTLASWWGRK